MQKEAETTDEKNVLVAFVPWVPLFPESAWVPGRSVLP